VHATVVVYPAKDIRIGDGDGANEENGADRQSAQHKKVFSPVGASMAAHREPHHGSPSHSRLWELH
jgi:hypothetical protein